MLRDTGSVLTCHTSRDSAVFNAEIGASVAILAAGFNIASFLTRYAGVDFREERARSCNGRASPLGAHSFDGLTPGALEVVFPKVKQSLWESGLATHVEAVKLSEWLLAPVKGQGLGLQRFEGWCSGDGVISCSSRIGVKSGGWRQRGERLRD